MGDLVIADRLRELLAAHLLEVRDLVEAVGLSEIVESEDRPGSYRCRCVVPVRRAFDPETAELRRLVLTLVRHEPEGWKVEAIDGLGEIG